MINEIFGEFDDPEGNFVEQFQTGAFDARIFELYLFAYLTRSGYRVQRNHAQPDFIATRDGITVAIEATTVNPRVPQLASTDLPPPPELRRHGEITWISADCSRQFELKRVKEAGRPYRGGDPADERARVERRS